MRRCAAPALAVLTGSDDRSLQVAGDGVWVRSGRKGGGRDADRESQPRIMGTGHARALVSAVLQRDALSARAGRPVLARSIGKNCSDGGENLAIPVPIGVGRDQVKIGGNNLVGSLVVSVNID